MNTVSLKKSSIFFALCVSMSMALASNPTLLETKAVTEQSTSTPPTTSTDASWEEKLYTQVCNACVKVTVRGVEPNLSELYKRGEEKNWSGTGFFVDVADKSEGNIYTNYHVVDNSDKGGLYIQHHKVGKERFKVEIVSIAPDYDFAHIRLLPKELARLKEKLNVNKLQTLPIGSSDKQKHGMGVMIVGHPLGDDSPKGTTGTIAGHQAAGCMGEVLNVTAAANPGNSGGPCINKDGEVIGIISAGRFMNSFQRAEGLNIVIPMSYLEPVIAESQNNKIINQPNWGLIMVPSSTNLCLYYGMDKEQGIYVRTVLPNSIADKAGIKQGDIICKINDYPVDNFGLMNVPWSDEKISITSYLARCPNNCELTITLWRKISGKTTITAKTVFNGEENNKGIKKFYFPVQKAPCYTVFGSLVITELSQNYIADLSEKREFAMFILQGFNQEMLKYIDIRNYQESKLIISHVFPEAELEQYNLFTPGDNVIDTINGTKVTTIPEFEKVILQAMASGDKFIEIKTDLGTRAAIPMPENWEQEEDLAQKYAYPLPELIKQIKVTKDSETTKTIVTT